MIFNTNNIDILGKRVDGGVDLVILSTGGLDDLPETQTSLLDKVECYLHYIASETFKNEFGALMADKIHIILKVDEPLSALHSALFDKIVDWVGESGATIRLERI